jgi:hypothetical protein
MASNPVTPKPTVSSVLNSLSAVGGYVGLAVQIGQVLVPVGLAAVKKIKDAVSGVETITYTLLLSEDQAVLANVDAVSTADLQAVNSELVRQGAQPLPIPGS